MFGFQTLSCLHDIPVVRSSTDKLQDVYAKAKDTSVLIRLPCSLVETVADKSLKIALTVANPFVKPFSGSVRVIDDYAAQKLRQMESKYPAINTPTEDVVNTFNEKTEPVRHAMNSMKDSTTSTIQQGKETVSNVATATVNKASDVADTVYSFCETHVPGIQRRQQAKNGYVFSAVGSLVNYVLETVQSSVVWVRMLAVFFLLKIKQTNDVVLHKLHRKSLLTVLPQRLLIVLGGFLEYVIHQVRPDDRTLAELKKPKQQSRLNKQPQYPVNRQSVRVEPPVTTRQSVVVTQQERTVTRRSEPHYTNNTQSNYSNMNDKNELHARLAAGGSRQSTSQYVETNGYNAQPNYANMTDSEELHARLLAGGSRQSTSQYVDNTVYTTESVDHVTSGDIAQLHAQLNPTDVELLYSRLPNDIIPDTEDQEPLTSDQQTLHARLIGASLERQGYPVDEKDQ